MLPFDKICSDRVTQFLSERNYSGIAKTIHTVLYKRTLLESKDKSGNQ